jgi:hypothetical protein
MRRRLLTLLNDQLLGVAISYLCLVVGFTYVWRARSKCMLAVARNRWKTSVRFPANFSFFCVRCERIDQKSFSDHMGHPCERFGKVFLIKRKCCIIMYRGYGARQARPRNTGLLMLALQIFNIGLEHIPPATLALVGAQTFLFAYPIFQPFTTPWWGLPKRARHH